MVAEDFADEVLTESARWVSPWHPPGSCVVQQQTFTYYVLGDTAVLMDADLTQIRHRLVEEFSESARSNGARHVELTVGPDRGDDTNRDRDALLRAGGRVVSEIDVLGVQPTRAFLDTITPPQGVTVEPVVDRAGTELFLRTSNEAWDYDPPDVADVDRAFDDLRPGSFIAHLDGVAAGTGGYSLVGGAARFWGASVLTPFRHKGVYRALVRTRVDDAERRGARVALVHALPTSSPILRSLGFEIFGIKTTVRFDLPD